jgi:hypothetical protein
MELLTTVGEQMGCLVALTADLRPDTAHVLDGRLRRNART